MHDPSPRKPQVRDDLLNHARRMRRDATDAEKRLWSIVRGRPLGGFKFRRQHPVGSFILDFYCEQCRVAVELDGGQHMDPAQEQKDASRTRDLLSRGVRVLRFWNNEVLNNPAGVARSIHSALTGEDVGVGGRGPVGARPHPDPLPEGEGAKARRPRGAS